MSEIIFENKSENKRSWLVPVLLIVFVGIIAATMALSGTFNSTATTEKVPETPQALWESQEVENYRYTLQIGCFCPPEMRDPVTIEVINGETASITYVADGTAVSQEIFFENHNTIDKLFTVINEAEAQDPARSDITYDETYGIPLSVNIDISEMMADEEIYLTVSDFEPLN